MKNFHIVQKSAASKVGMLRTPNYIATSNFIAQLKSIYTNTILLIYIYHIKSVYVNNVIFHILHTWHTCTSVLVSFLSVDIFIKLMDPAVPLSEFTNTSTYRKIISLSTCICRLVSQINQHTISISLTSAMQHRWHNYCDIKYDITQSYDVQFYISRLAGSFLSTNNHITIIME